MSGTTRCSRASSPLTGSDFAARSRKRRGAGTMMSESLRPWRTRIPIAHENSAFADRRKRSGPRGSPRSGCRRREGVAAGPVAVRRRLDRFPDCHLVGSYRERRVGRDFRRARIDRRIEVLVRDYAGHESHTLGLGCVEQPAREEHLACRTRSDAVHQKLHVVEPVSEAEAGRGHRETGAVARELEIAHLHELEAAADREASHPSDEGFLDCADDLAGVRDQCVVHLRSVRGWSVCPRTRRCRCRHRSARSPAPVRTTTGTSEYTKCSLDSSVIR